MRKYRHISVVAFSSAAMLFLLINTRDSITFATEALKLCAASLIPSLFPFMFLAVLLNGTLSGCEFRALRVLRPLCRTPSGSEALFLLGILGGYPVGAQVISNSYHNGNLSKEDAERMLGFCNNAGPSFIFGVIGPLFSSPLVPALLWLIQIVSAIITGALLKGSVTNTISVRKQTGISITEALEKSVKSMGLICGWVILFKIVAGFLEQLLQGHIPDSILTVITGLLELTNGCVGLYKVANDGAKFVLASAFLSLGGLCVALQTASATKGLSIKKYLWGKCIQCVCCVFLSLIAQQFIFQAENRLIHLNFYGIIGLILVSVITIFLSCKKTVAFPERVIYN